MSGPWNNVMISNHADANVSNNQTRAKASVNWRFRDGSGQEVGGFVYLQRLGETPNFRLLIEGSQLITDVPTEYFGRVSLPVDGSWKMKSQPLVSANSGKALAIRIDFKGWTTCALKRIQITLPLIPGNSRKSKIFDEALQYANVERSTP